MVNFEEVSVHGGISTRLTATLHGVSRVLVPERRSLSDESAAAVAFCHLSLVPADVCQQQQQRKRGRSHAAVTTSASEVHSVFLLNSGCA